MDNVTELTPAEKLISLENLTRYDTNLKGYISENISNPNLLDNSDLRVNQRGKTEYIAKNNWSVPVYCVDRWIVMTDAEADIAAGTNKATVNDDGTVTITVANSYWTRLYQLFESPLNGTYTVTTKIKSATEGLRFDMLVTEGDHITETNIGANVLTGSEQIISLTADFVNISAIALNARSDLGYGSAEIEWVKLECGGVATLYTFPDPATEMNKCQRYYQIRTKENIDPNDLCPSMRITPTVTQIADGSFAYNAEL